MDRTEAIKKMFVMICEVYDKQLSKQGREIFSDMLRGCTNREIAESIKMHIKDPDRGRWPPKPADLHYQVGILRESDRRKVERIAHPVLTAGNITGEHVEFDGGQFGLPGKHRCEVRLLTSYLQSQVAEKGIGNDKLLEVKHD